MVRSGVQCSFDCKRPSTAQLPSSRIELGNSSQFHFPSSHSVSTMAAATNPVAAPIKGLSTANQKETFHSRFSGFGSLFMQLSQAFEDRHFTKREISFGCFEGRGPHDFSARCVLLRSRLPL